MVTVGCQLLYVRLFELQVSARCTAEIQHDQTISTRSTHRPANPIYTKGLIKSWVDAHTNLPPGQGGLQKADVAPRSNQAGSVNPPVTRRVFLWFKRR